MTGYNYWQGKSKNVGYARDEFSKPEFINAFDDGRENGIKAVKQFLMGLTVRPDGMIPLDVALSACDITLENR